MFIALPSQDIEQVVERTAEFWHRYRGARLFLTGATGFIGTWLVEIVRHANAMLGSDIQVVALSRDPDAACARAMQVFGASHVRFVRGDAVSFDRSIGAVDLCIHAATDVSDPRKAANRLQTFDTALMGTRRVLEAALENGAQRFLLTSSGAVYGPQPPELAAVSETFMQAPSPLDVASAYGQGKRAAEWLTCAISEHTAMAACIARIYALIGPGLPLDGTFAAGNFIRDAVAGNPIQIQGDGSPCRTYLYVADACVWLLEMLMRGTTGAAYNVGSEHVVSIRTLAERIRDASGSNAALTIAGTPTAALPQRYVPDTSKARGELGLEEHVGLNDAIHKTISWARMTTRL
ncbi:NAD-dependent epimerase/dehydratase family protein [Pandoraea terrigena]|uniref:dTDP-glucose 4,6-dehydratase n=1 Tax=Pandoraea terrigena TaxID=2508292 RepID=A0A5E4VUU6_9BURK|nr:NAD-dependent epimerase/dehydratase family protein [Pandoraea terrigena]VVE14745.1 dTDP-glucose 4,6-dehydratase [Pandoraea terrigena]